MLRPKRSFASVVGQLAEQLRAGSVELHKGSVRVEAQKRERLLELASLGAQAAEEARFTAAEDLYLQAIKLAGELGAEQWSAGLYYDVAWVATRRRDFARAQEFFRRVIELAGDLGDTRVVIALDKLYTDNPTIEEIKRDRIQLALEINRGNAEKAAKLLDYRSRKPS